jgi:hypothetical protein
MQGAYNMYVDSFFIDGNTSFIINIAIRELIQSHSFDSSTQNNTIKIGSLYGTELSKESRPIQITDLGLFNNKQITVALSKVASISTITFNWQLTLVSEKII